MRKNLFWQILLNHYPQNNWVKAIEKELCNLDFKKNTIVVDAPCGNGAISYWLSNKIQNKFELIDKSKLFTRIISSWAKNDKNICLKNGDLFDTLGIIPAEDIWLLINSLYLFTNPLDMIKMYKPRFKYIIAILPYLEQTNYHYYCKRPFRSINIHNFTVEETLTIFSNCGYSLQSKLNLISIPFFKYDLWGFGSFLRYFFGFFDKDINPPSGQYWLGVFVRETNS